MGVYLLVLQMLGTVSKCLKFERRTGMLLNTGVARIPGSMPSVFGAPETGDKIVTFETVTFVQS